jgi:hypothetical protein
VDKSDKCRWTHDEYNYYMPECLGDFVDAAPEDIVPFNFCPYCGKPIEVEVSDERGA